MGSPAIAWSRDGSGRHGSTESRWLRPDSSGNFGIAVGPRKMDRTVSGSSVVENVGLDMPHLPALYTAAEKSGGGSSPVSHPCNHATRSRSLASALALLTLFITSISYAV